MNLNTNTLSGSNTHNNSYEKNGLSNNIITNTNINSGANITMNTTTNINIYTIANTKTNIESNSNNDILQSFCAKRFWQTPRWVIGT